jgi:hypothetical protein
MLKTWSAFSDGAKIIILHDWSDARFELDHPNLAPLDYCSEVLNSTRVGLQSNSDFEYLTAQGSLFSMHGATQPTNRHVLKEIGKKTLLAPPDSSMSPRNRRRTDQSMICSACQCDQIPMA